MINKIRGLQNYSHQPIILKYINIKQPQFGLIKDMEKIQHHHTNSHVTNDKGQNQFQHNPSSLETFTPLIPKNARVSFSSLIKIDDSFLEEHISQNETENKTPNALVSNLHSINDMVESKISQSVFFSKGQAQKWQNFNQLRKKLTLNDQFITGISQRYNERINLLQKTNRSYKQQVCELSEATQHLQSQNKKMRRQMLHMQQKLTLLQNQNSVLHYQIQQFDNTKRQLQLIKFNHQQVFTSTNRYETLRKKLESRQKKYKQVLDSMHQSCLKVQKQKEALQFEYSKLKSKFEQLQKDYENQLKEQQKQYSHQRQNYERQIHKLESRLKQKAWRQNILESGQKQLKKSIELEKNNDEKMKEEIALLNYQLGNLKQSLSLTQNSLFFTKQEMKSLSTENEQIKKLIAKMDEKDQLINILRNKIRELEDMIENCELKGKEQEQAVRDVQEEKLSLQQDKKDLEEVIKNQKQSIQQLVIQLEQLEITLQKTRDSFQKSADKMEQQRKQYQQKHQRIIENEQLLAKRLQEIQTYVSQERKKNSLLQDQCRSLKHHNSQLQQIIQRLNGEKIHLSEHLIKLANDSELYDHKATTLQSKLQELKEIHIMKESMFSQQIQHYSKKQLEKDKQMRLLREQLNNFRLRIQQIEQQKQQLYTQYLGKQRQFEQLQYQLFQLRNEKYRFEHKLQMVQSECRNSYLKVNEYHEEVQNLKKYVEQLEIHINQLDNILVWDFEGGAGENNNFQQRKIKMENIIKALRFKIGEVQILKAQKHQQSLIISEKSKKIQEYSIVISSFTEKIQKFLKEKDDLGKMIEDIQIDNKKLAGKLGVLKEKQVEWLNKEKMMSRKLKLKQDEGVALSEEKSIMVSRYQALQAKLKEKQSKIQQLSSKYASQREKSNSFKQMIEKLTSERRRIEDDSNRKTKELSKQLQSFKKDIEQKSKNVVQLEQEKKQQANLLNTQINSLKAEMKDFSTFYDSQKFNFTKRYGLLIDLGNSLSKLQKANGMKGNSLVSSLRDTLKKMEQFDSNSSRLFAKYDKFQSKNN